MGQFARGQVVLVRFPFSDLTGLKLRPALLLAEVEYGDVVLCQITSKTYGDRIAVTIEQSDLSQGTLPVTSYARPGRLLTAAPALVVRAVATVTEAKRQEITAAIARMLQ